VDACPPYNGQYPPAHLLPVRDILGCAVRNCPVACRPSKPSPPSAAKGKGRTKVISFEDFLRIEEILANRTKTARRVRGCARHSANERGSVQPSHDAGQCRAPSREQRIRANARPVSGDMAACPASVPGYRHGQARLTDGKQRPTCEALIADPGMWVTSGVRRRGRLDFDERGVDQSSRRTEQRRPGFGAQVLSVPRRKKPDRVSLAAL